MVCGFTLSDVSGVMNSKFEIECLLSKVQGHHGHTTSRQYLVPWKGYSPDDDTCEPKVNVHSEAIREYGLTNNDAYVHSWTSGCRDLTFNTRRGVKIHLAKNTSRSLLIPSPSKGRAQKRLPKTENAGGTGPTTEIMCEDVPLDNVVVFTNE